MYHLEKAPGRTASVNGKDYLFFSGYSYLGMGHVPEFLQLVQKGMDKFGLLHPSSRISNTRLDLYTQFERHLSLLTGCDETVTFSSGYLAARAVVDLFVKKETNCFVAPGTHAALQNGVKSLPLQRQWKKSLIQTIEDSIEREFILLADSVNPLTASIQDFNFLNSLSPRKKLTCVIDDSHGIGYMGSGGEGICHFLPHLPNVEFVLTYSLSKALHINGGGVSCSRHIAQQLRYSPYYSGSTPIAPSSVFAFMEGQHLYQTQHVKLYKNINRFSQYIKDVQGIISHPSLPVFLLKPEFDQSMFHPHQVIISSFSYPDPLGTRINRIVLNALHTESDLRKTAWLLMEMMV